MLEISTLTGNCPWRRRRRWADLWLHLNADDAEVSGVKDTSIKSKIRSELFEQCKTASRRTYGVLGLCLFHPPPRGCADQWLLKMSFQDGDCKSQWHELKMLPQKMEYSTSWSCIQKQPSSLRLTRKLEMSWVEVYRIGTWIKIIRSVFPMHLVLL